MPINNPLRSKFKVSPLNKLSFGLRGLYFITSGSPGSIPKAKAGSVSVIKLTHNIWIGLSGEAHPKSIARNNAIISPILQEIRNIIVFLIFVKMFLPYICFTYYNRYIAVAISL